MELSELINKLKDNALNLSIILVAFFISYNIYKKQNAEIAVLLESKAIEVKKSAILEKISGTEKRINLYKNFLTEKNANSVISFINEIAGGMGIKVVSIRPEAQSEDNEYIVKHPFGLTVETQDYHSLGKFISRIENHSDFYVVDNLNILAEQEAQKVTAQLKLSYIVFKN